MSGDDSVRYIIVDLEGASRLTFHDRCSLDVWLRGVGDEDREALGELLVETFDRFGERVGESQWADDFAGFPREREA